MIDVHECLRRLEPVLGERADKLWLIYLASDYQQKRKIEEVVRILCERHLNQDYKEREKIFLPPPPKKIADGDYRVGGVLYPEGLYCPFGIREEEWIQHIGIFGRSGSGKTNVAYVIINELVWSQVYIFHNARKRPISRISRAVSLSSFFLSTTLFTCAFVRSMDFSSSPPVPSYTPSSQSGSLFQPHILTRQSKFFDCRQKI